MFLLLCYMYVLTLQTLEIHLEIRSIDRSINALMLLISSVCATGFLISALVGNLLVKTRKVSRQSSMILGMENS
jgi:hypothetical protein